MSDARDPWLFSRRLDLFAFGGSALLSLLLVAVGVPLDLVDGAEPGARDTPEWAWLACIVLVDVAHVWGNLVLVYADPAELRSRPGLYAAVPLIGLVVGAALASEGELFFWRTLATLAVIHFVRQQVGWVKLYRAKNRELGDGPWARLVDEGTTYAVTLAPVVWWHAHLPRPFWWLAPDDFFVALPTFVGTLALVAEAFVLVVYTLKSLRAWRAGRGNPGKDLVVSTTALLWWLGIVALESDYAFTVTNVLIHGIPYIVLITVTARRRREASAHLAWPFAFGAAGVVLALVVAAFVEEGLWDRLVWHEREWLFPLPAFDFADARWMLVPLLALPQLTHYLLDAFLWRRRNNAFL